MIDSIDKPSPKATTDNIIARGPKNTRAYVAIASANHALGFTINHNRQCFPYKRFELFPEQKVINWDIRK